MHDCWFGNRLSISNKFYGEPPLSVYIIHIILVHLSSPRFVFTLLATNSITEPCSPENRSPEFLS